MSSPIKISGFERTFGVPVILDMSWEGIVAMLSDARRTVCSTSTCAKSACPHKDGECWSPATFRVARTGASVSAISLLVLDVDHAAESRIVEMCTQLARYQHLIHASHADRPGDRYLRVVVRLSRAVNPSEWSQFWLAAVHQLQIPADLACRDAARCYFLPSRPSDADYFVVSHDGEPLDVDTLMASATLVLDPAAPIAAQEGVVQ